VIAALKALVLAEVIGGAFLMWRWYGFGAFAGWLTVLALWIALEVLTRRIARTKAPR
jgi:hypothetical protein